jgi:hypothetical protein
MNRDLGIPLAPRANDAPSAGWAEKRRHPRRQLTVRCWMSDGQHTLYARVHDVSLGGLSIRAPVAFSPNVELQLALVLASDLADHEATVSIRAQGRVVWVRSPRGDLDPLRARSAPRMGAEFLRVLEGEDMLRDLIGHT